MFAAELSSKGGTLVVGAPLRVRGAPHSCARARRSPASLTCTPSCATTPSCVSTLLLHCLPSSSLATVPTRQHTDTMSPLWHAVWLWMAQAR